MNQLIPSYRRSLLLALTLLFSAEGAFLLLTESQAAGPKVVASQEQNVPVVAGEVDLSINTRATKKGQVSAPGVQLDGKLLPGGNFLTTPDAYQTILPAG